jgi:N-acetylmuramoyl-L-alanine amidase CwlA
VINLVKIIKQLIPLGHPNRKGVKIKPVGVIVHYTANDAPTASDSANVNYASRAYKNINGAVYEANGKDKFRYGSAHWYIDQDSATLAIPTDENCWGCGDKQFPKNNGYNGQTKIARDVFGYRQNYLTINYEICNNDIIRNSTADWDKACNNAIEIIAQDMIKYNIPITMVYRHHDISGKICPKPFVDNPKAWDEFKKKLQYKINELKNPKPKEITFEEALKIVADKIDTQYKYWYDKRDCNKYFKSLVIKLSMCEFHKLSDVKLSFEQALKIVSDKAKIDYNYWYTNRNSIDKFYQALIVKCAKYLI